jgi:pullulanase/glycogen debranching enzyme
MVRLIAITGHLLLNLFNFSVKVSENISMKINRFVDVLPGRSWPLGATVMGSGVNFSIFSKHATAVELVLFERQGDKKPLRIISLNPGTNKTFYY